MVTNDAAREALAFLTSLGRSKKGPSPDALTWFAAVGATIGGVEGLIWRAARRFWPNLPAAVLVTSCDAFLTGALHLDGLADSADGLLAHVATKDRLAIMSTPDLGTFGAVALGIALIGRVAALASREPSPLLLAALTGGARATMALAIGSLPYARSVGLASAFSSPEGREQARRAGLTGIVGAFVLGALADKRRGPLAVACGLLAATAVLLGARKQVGGYTGDVLGASGTAFEVVGLLVAARR